LFDRRWPGRIEGDAELGRGVRELADFGL